MEYTSPHEEWTMAIQSTISEIQNSQVAAQQQQAKKNDPTALGKNEFLKLLTTQLQYQDPTQPMDSTAFVAQLAQFSTLEQMTNTNDTLVKMLTGQATALQTTAAAFVGKTAVFNTDQVALTEGKSATITANLAQTAANVTMTILDSNGETVRTVGLGACPSGLNAFTWDGHDDGGDLLPPGIYTVQLVATGLEGKPVALTQSGSAPITGVVFGNGAPKFIAGGSLLQLSDISELNE